ncbi:expressed unknown protein [Seminavis robusta]|uniref:Uncharacterized protein n=1 Tax=Seminavis robusta TaxID=568900 RepID=A0A9N8HEA8_9STRA|nr:expressed unknown protein [Seminavis robusta]|eukprot:Sro396_g134240.1 n/a (666) ;mRNA; r:19560-21557
MQQQKPSTTLQGGLLEIALADGSECGDNYTCTTSEDSFDKDEFAPDLEYYEDQDQSQLQSRRKGRGRRTDGLVDDPASTRRKSETKKGSPKATEPRATRRHPTRQRSRSLTGTRDTAGLRGSKKPLLHGDKVWAGKVDAPAEVQALKAAKAAKKSAKRASQQRRASITMGEPTSAPRHKVLNRRSTTIGIPIHSQKKPSGGLADEDVHQAGSPSKPESPWRRGRKPACGSGRTHPRSDKQDLGHADRNEFDDLAKAPVERKPKPELMPSARARLATTSKPVAVAVAPTAAPTATRRRPTRQRSRSLTSTRDTTGLRGSKKPLLYGDKVANGKVNAESEVQALKAAKAAKKATRQRRASITMGEPTSRPKVQNRRATTIGIPMHCQELSNDQLDSRHEAPQNRGREPTQGRGRTKHAFSDLADDPVEPKPMPLLAPSVSVSIRPGTTSKSTTAATQSRATRRQPTRQRSRSLTGTRDTAGLRGSKKPLSYGNRVAPDQVDDLASRSISQGEPQSQIPPRSSLQSLTLDSHRDGDSIIDDLSKRSLASRSSLSRFLESEGEGQEQTSGQSGSQSVTSGQSKAIDEILRSRRGHQQGGPSEPGLSTGSRRDNDMALASPRGTNAQQCGLSRDLSSPSLRRKRGHDYPDESRLFTLSQRGSARQTSTQH